MYDIYSALLNNDTIVYLNINSLLYIYSTFLARTNLLFYFSEKTPR